MATLRTAADVAVDRLPVVRGASQQHVSAAFRDVVNHAGREAERLGDEYVSTEHLLLGLVERAVVRPRRADRRGRDAGGADDARSSPCAARSA